MSDINPYKAPTSPAERQQGVAVVGLSVTAAMLDHLRLTRPWVRFLSVMGFIGLGFMGFAGLLMLLMSFAPNRQNSGFTGLIAGPSYLALGAVYLWPVLALHRFGRALTRLLAEGNGEALEGALRQQFSFWKVIGIFTIVMVGLVILLVPIVAFLSASTR